MCDKMEFIAVIDIEGDRVEAVTTPKYLDKATLWVTKPGSDLKINIGQFSSDIVGELTLIMIADMVNKNLKMKKFDFESLIQSAISEV